MAQGNVFLPASKEKLINSCFQSPVNVLERANAEIVTCSPTSCKIVLKEK